MILGTYNGRFNKMLNCMTVHEVALSAKYSYVTSFHLDGIKQTVHYVIHSIHLCKDLMDRLQHYR